MPNSDAIDFPQLVEEYYQPLYRFGFSLTKNESSASDLTQQTFLIWAKKGESLRDKSKVKSWLFTTLYREFLRIRRRSNHQVEMEPDAFEAQLPPVSSEIGKSMDAHYAVDLLQELDPVYREPLILFYLEDLTYKEIAETLDLPIGTVMSRLNRGKAKLKIQLSEKLGK